MGPGFSGRCAEAMVGLGCRLVQDGTMCEQMDPHPKVHLLWGKHDSGLESKLEPA